MDDNLFDRFVSDLNGVAESDILEDLQERADLIRHKLKFIEDRPKVACLTGIEPPQLAKGWLADAIRIAGGEPVGLAGVVSWEQIHSLSADIIILVLDRQSLEQSLQQLGGLLQVPGFLEMQAIKNGRLYITDASGYFTGNPSAAIDAVSMLAEIINPKQFIFGFEGSGWAKFSL